MYSYGIILNMLYDNIPEKPLHASVNEKEYPMNRVYFFERPDGSIISCEEREAWGLYARAPQELGVRRPPFKFVGSSNGALYGNAIRESKAIMRETGDLQKAQEHLRAGEKLELESARTTPIPPRNMDKMGPAANELFT